MIAWADELESQYEKISAAAPKTSTLAKRGPRDRKAEDEEARPSKRVKVEAGASGAEDQVRSQYEKGALSKVFIYYVDHATSQPMRRLLLTKVTLHSSRSLFSRSFSFPMVDLPLGRKLTLLSGSRNSWSRNEGQNDGLALCELTAQWDRLGNIELLWFAYRLSRRNDNITRCP